jgi:hypothetical protein
MKKLFLTPLFLLCCSMATLWGQATQSATSSAPHLLAEKPALYSPVSAPFASDYDNYGGKLGIGISILNGFGVPARYYISPKNVAELGFYTGGIAVYAEDNTGGGIELESYELGFMMGAGYTHFGNRFLKQKKRKNKVRAHGVALRANQLFGDFQTTFTSLGWAMETFRENKTHKSFIFELGLQGAFPDFVFDGRQINDPQPGIYLRCHWNFFLD